MQDNIHKGRCPQTQFTLISCYFFKNENKKELLPFLHSDTVAQDSVQRQTIASSVPTFMSYPQSSSFLTLVTIMVFSEIVSLVLLCQTKCKQVKVGIGTQPYLGKKEYQDKMIFSNQGKVWGRKNVRKKIIAEENLTE